MTQTSIEWLRGVDGKEGMSWNALRAVRKSGGRPDVTANHCETVNEACRFCYANVLNARLGGLPFKPGHRKDYNFVVSEKILVEPLRKRKPTKIFVESMSDAFGDWWPREFIVKLYAVMALTPHHTYINLSKRPERRRRFLADPNLRDDIAKEMWALTDRRTDHIPGGLPLQNVIEGVSVSCQSEADEFVPILLRTNAALRAVSAEPLLGAINFACRCGSTSDVHHIACDATTRPPLVAIDWIITGGESGGGARPLDPAWVRDIRDQCAHAGTEFHFKQWGAHRPLAADESPLLTNEALRGRGAKIVTMPSGARMLRVKGKKLSGRLLDGVEHNGFPRIAFREGA